MNLVQKLSIGLGLASVMLLSSCSKEEVVAPEVQKDGKMLSSESSMKYRGPEMASSQGQVTGNSNLSSTLNGWAVLHSAFAGVSNYTEVFGDPAVLWETELPLIFPGPTTFVTIKAKKNYSGQAYSGWSITMIKGLIPGKKYKLTFSLSTSRPFGATSPYVDKAEAFVYSSLDPQASKKEILFAGKQGQWVTESITFIAKEAEQGFNVRFSEPNQVGEKNYLNILLSENAIQQIN